MKNQPHLVNRNGYFYFRIAISQRLMARLGKKELMISLRTTSRIEGKTRAGLLYPYAQQIFSMAYKEESQNVLEYLREAVDRICFDPMADYAPSIEVKRQPVERPSKAASGKAFSKVFEAYLGECKGERPSGLAKKQFVCDLWLQIIGDEPAASIGKLKGVFQMLDHA